MAVRFGDVDPKPLAQPLKFPFSGKEAKNRLLKSPMAEVLATWSAKNLDERGIPTNELIELYRRWGEGANNWGIVVTGNIDTQADHPNCPGDMIVPPDAKPEGERFEKFKELAAAAKANGSLLVAQITHPGRQVQHRVNPNAVSASDVQLEPKMGMTFGKPHAATKDEIAQIVEGFAHTAEYLEKAGFDGIELHAAHGYLISQFLSRTTNLRTDEYGTQNTENRLRFLSDITRAIKARVSSTFIVSAKLNSVEFQDGGVTPEEAHEVCEMLENLGMDFVELSGGTYEESGFTWKKDQQKAASTSRREAFFLEFAEAISQALGPERKMKIFIAGGLRTVGAMVDALNVVDGVSLGRPAAAEPRLSRDILEGRVLGALRPLEGFEQEFGTGLVVATAQIAQIGRGKEPFALGDAATMQQFGKDMGVWYQGVVADGDKMEVFGGVKFSGPEVPYLAMA